MATKAKKSAETPPLEDITDTLQNTSQTIDDLSNVKTGDMPGGDGLVISDDDNSGIVLKNEIETLQDALQTSDGGPEITGDNDSGIIPEELTDPALSGAEETGFVFNIRVLNVPGGVRHRAGLTFTESGVDVDFSKLTDKQIEKIKNDRFLRIKRVKNVLLD